LGKDVLEHGQDFFFRWINEEPSLVEVISHKFEDSYFLLLDITFRIKAFILFILLLIFFRPFHFLWLELEVYSQVEVLL
jgi:hypothetical protein